MKNLVDPARPGRCLFGTILLGIALGGWVRSAEPAPTGGGAAPAQDSQAVDEERDVEYGRVDGTTLRLDIYRLRIPDPKPVPALVMIHGGGWKAWPDGKWTKATDRETARAFARAGYWVASIDYRLSDVAPFPAALLDCKRAVRWVRSNSRRLGVDPDRMGVWGFSAGAHLALLVGCAGADSGFEDEAERSEGSSRVQAVSSWAGLSDLADPSGPRRLEGERLDLARRFLGGTYEEKPDVYRRASPITYVTRGSPPVFLVHGDHDERVPYSHSEVMLEKLRSAGVEADLLTVRGAGHLFFKDEAQDPPISGMIEATLGFFNRHLKGAGSNPGASQGERASSAGTRWYKGNTHAHSLWDNGDALPELVAEWYRSRGYDFLVLSDHNDQNSLTERERWVAVGTRSGDPVPPSLPEELDRRFGSGWAAVRKTESGRELRLKTFGELEAAFGKDGRFLLIPGEEIGDSMGNRLVHHNALNIRRVILPPGGSSVRELLERAMDAVQSESTRTGQPALAQLNHPNLGWAVGAEDLEAVAKERFFEVYNGHPIAQNRGDSTHPGTEAMWDRVLTARLRSGTGPLLYGLASDDAHHYSGRGAARPGRGWIFVRAPRLSAPALLRAIEAGDFYSSTGVTLTDLVRDECGLLVRVLPEPGISYAIRFIGSRDGKPGTGCLLQETGGTEGYYTFEGDELFVRAVVVSDRPVRDPVSEGELQTAWAQPVIVGWSRAK